MFSKVYRSFFVLLLVIGLFSTTSAAEINYPTPDGYVTDSADIISTSLENQLENDLQNFESRTSTEVAVVTVPDLQGLTIEEFTYNLGTSWGVGQKDVDNGIVFLIAPTERQTRIEVGYGLEGALTDIVAYGIISKDVNPYFKNNDFDGGILMGVNDIIAATENEEFAQQLAGTSSSNIPSIVFTVFLLLMFAFVFLGSLLARSKSWWAGGIIGAFAGIIVTVINQSLWLTIPGLVTVGLIFDYLVSKNYARKGKKSFWSNSGSSNGGSFGSSSGSSFGGGSFGGGGASGSW